MKFPIPTQHFDQNGAVPRLTAAIRKAGSALHNIVDNPEGGSSAEILGRAEKVAIELGDEQINVVKFIMGTVPQSTFSMSTSTLAAIMDVNAFVAEILNAVDELKGEPDVTLDVLNDLAFELSTHDHAKSAADWIDTRG